LLHLHLHSGVSLLLDLEQISGAHIDESILLSHDLRLGGATGSRGSEEDDPRRSSGSTVAVSDPEDAGQIVGNVALRLVSGVVLVDKLVESVHDGAVVQLEFVPDLAGDVVQLRSIQRLVNVNAVLLDSGERELLADVQHDELVRDDAHLLQRQGLHFGPGEALNDPALLRVLTGIDFLLNQVDNDLVVDYRTSGVIIC